MTATRKIKQPIQLKNGQYVGLLVQGLPTSEALYQSRVIKQGCSNLRDLRHDRASPGHDKKDRRIQR